MIFSRNCTHAKSATARPVFLVNAVKSGKRAQYKNSGSRNGDVDVITAELDGSDVWRMEEVVDRIAAGQVGIIPTDTLPAIVCDLENKEAVLRLYKVKDLDPKKPLSILVHSFQEVSYYTSGFPNSNEPGQPNWFNIMRRMLPGPYTLILPATKNLPSQCVDFMKNKNVHRRAVGIRMPDNPISQEILSGLGRPLLCTSVHSPEHIDENTEVPDLGTMMELYSNKGLDFIVDVGRHIATCSTIVDMTGDRPEVLREGKGDASVFRVYE